MGDVIVFMPLKSHCEIIFFSRDSLTSPGLHMSKLLMGFWVYKIKINILK